MNAAGELIGLGTYRLGEKTYRICSEAIDLGYRHIDTASLYGNEEAVGEAVRASGVDRDAVTITSKVWIDDIASARIADAVARSVERIGHVDVMLLHAPVGDAAALSRSWETLLTACKANGVPTAGVSNYRQVDLDALSSVPTVNQLEVSPFWPRTDLVARCRRDGTQVTAHSALTKARRLDHPVLSDVAAEVEVAGGRATPAQVMLAWSVAQGLLPLARSQSIDRLVENLTAAEIVLRPDQLARLDALDDGFVTHPQHR